MPDFADVCVKLGGSLILARFEILFNFGEVHRFLDDV